MRSPPARLSSDPTRDLRGALTAPTVTHYGAIIDPARVGELLRAIDGYEGQPITKLAMQLAPHVFVRPGELRHAEWSEFDFRWRVVDDPGEQEPRCAKITSSRSRVSPLRSSKTSAR